METTQQEGPKEPIDSKATSESVERHLVNPVALRQCSINWSGKAARILDLSFVRVVCESFGHDIPEKEPITVEFQLDRHEFLAPVVLMTAGNGWVRCGFERMLPSAQAHLRSFLSPKKIGESIMEDWRNDDIRHFHGLNESELWIQTNGTVIFTYLDSCDGSEQFFVRMIEGKMPLQIGRIARKDYMGMTAIDAALPLIPISDREISPRLGDCRDIITNFRPTGQIEYNLKQKLLKGVSDNLYSTNSRVELSAPPRVMSLPVEGQ